MSTTTLPELSRLLIELYDKISSWEQTVVKDSGLSPTQMHAIEIVGHHPQLRMKEMAAKMGITTGTLTVMVDRLEQLGMMTRQPHPADRRSYVIALTALGQRHFCAHHTLHELLTTELTADLAEAEVLELRRILDTIVQRF